MSHSDSIEDDQRLMSHGGQRDCDLTGFKTHCWHRHLGGDNDGWHVLEISARMLNVILGSPSRLRNNNFSRRDFAQPTCLQRYPKLTFITLTDILKRILRYSQTFSFGLGSCVNLQKCHG